MPALTQLLLVSKFERAFLDPEGHTYFRSVFKPYSNFAIESVENQFSQNANFGKVTTARITNQGDIIVGGYLELNLPALAAPGLVVTGATKVAWVNTIGHAIVEEVTFKIGGIEFDKQYGEWLEIYSEYQLTYLQKIAYDEMVGKYPDGTIDVLNGNADVATQYIVPLRFWWDKAGVGLPSAALEGVDLEIHMRFRSAVSMVKADITGSSLIASGTPAFDSAKFWIDFAFVSDEERAELVAAPQTYLVTQIMRTTSDSISFSTTASDFNFTLQFNLPATDFIWLVQDDANTDGDVLNNDWFNYGLNNGASATDFFSQAVLKINNVNREEPRGPLFFRNYRPQKTHTASPNAFLYEFPFSLHPEAFQPSGTMNFSKADSSTLVLTKKALASGTKTGQARGYIKKLNTVTVVRGVAGLGFAS